MSVMCSKEGCTTRKGMCGHEKMMVFLAMVLGTGVAGHYLFHWF